MAAAGYLFSEMNKNWRSIPLSLSDFEIAELLCTVAADPFIDGIKRAGPSECSATNRLPETFVKVHARGICLLSSAQGRPVTLGEQQSGPIDSVHVKPGARVRSQGRNLRKRVD